MITLIRREFTVNAPNAQAWQHLSRVEEWPSWAVHIRRIELVPPGALTAQSVGRIHLRNGIRSTFRVVEFSPGRNWKWVGRFLWLTVHYDHRFEEIDDQNTRLVWIVEAEGRGASILGRLFAALYSRNLDRAIPALVAEMNRTAAAAIGDRGGRRVM